MKQSKEAISRRSLCLHCLNTAIETSCFCAVRTFLSLLKRCFGIYKYRIYLVNIRFVMFCYCHKYRYCFTFEWLASVSCLKRWEKKGRLYMILLQVWFRCVFTGVWCLNKSLLDDPITSGSFKFRFFKINRNLCEICVNFVMGNGASGLTCWVLNYCSLTCNLE